MFQSTRPRGARRYAADTRHAVILFQSTRPRGARPIAIHGATCSNVFQSTRPRGARRADIRVLGCPEPSFQSTRPRGARPVQQRHDRSEVGRFNPRARAGRDALGSVTSSLLVDRFQSTRPRGARRCCIRLSIRRSAAFQSTRPRGARPRPRRLDRASRSVFQSTRPRGARLQIRHDAIDIMRRFNPRARAGRDSDEVNPRRRCTGSFNPRARAGRDETAVTHRDGASSFNPRARAGRDSCRTAVLLRHILVSIHAPARGATPITMLPNCGSAMFQSTRPRGARHRARMLPP